MADSCGFLILSCGDRRMVYENTEIMYHQLSWGGFYDKVRTIDETNEQVKKDQEKLENIVLTNTKITQEQLDFVNERKQDWYMTPQEALKLGVVDEIMKPQKKKKK